MEKVTKWLQVIEAYDRKFSGWEERVKKLLKRYAQPAEQETEDVTKFNILWSNVQTLTSATLAKVPKPDVSRRFRDNDPVGRVASLILERSLDYEVQKYNDYYSSLKLSTQDRFLGGRGIAWLRYEPHIKARQEGLPTDGAQITEDVDQPQEELDYESACCDYVHYNDFGHTLGRTWEEVTAVWRRVFMTRSQCIERFGEELGSQIPLDSIPDELKEIKEKSEESRAKIYEIWDKETKTALWISKSLGKIIDEKPDPLNLEDFWPCPKPLYATLVNGSLEPIPDYVIYQEQAATLDVLAKRIDSLSRALKVAGVYDAAQALLQRVFTEIDDTGLIPMENWAALSEKGGVPGAISLVDIRPIIEALREAYVAFDQVKNQIYELTGISDIVRGDTNPNETLGAQELKGQYANLRLKSYQDEVSRYATEILQIKAQIICNKFNYKTIIAISAAEQLSQQDQQLIPDAMVLLLGKERIANPEAPPGPNPMRSFRVEVAADSLVFLDEKTEQQSRTEFLTAVGGFMQNAIPAAENNPAIAPLLLEMLKFGVRGFKVGKTIEGAFDEAAEKLKQAAQQPKPNPEMQKVQAEQQAKQQQMQMDAQAEQQKQALEEQARQREMQAEIQMRTMEANLEARLEQQRMLMEQQAEHQRLAFEAQLEQERMLREEAFEKFKAQLEAETKIDVATISANASTEQAEISAEAAKETQKDLS